MRGTAYIHVTLTKTSIYCLHNTVTCMYCTFDTVTCMYSMCDTVTYELTCELNSKSNTHCNTLQHTATHTATNTATPHLWAVQQKRCTCKRFLQVQRGVIVCGIAHTVYTRIQFIRAYNVFAHTIYTRIYMYYYCMRDTAYIHVILSKTSLYCVRNLPYARYCQGRNID